MAKTKHANDVGKNKEETVNALIQLKHSDPKETPTNKETNIHSISPKASKENRETETSKNTSSSGTDKRRRNTDTSEVEPKKLKQTIGNGNQLKSESSGVDDMEDAKEKETQSGGNLIDKAHTDRTKGSTIKAIKEATSNRRADNSHVTIATQINPMITTDPSVIQHDRAGSHKYVDKTHVDHVTHPNATITTDKVSLGITLATTPQDLASTCYPYLLSHSHPPPPTTTSCAPKATTTATAGGKSSTNRRTHQSLPRIDTAVQTKALSEEEKSAIKRRRNKEAAQRYRQKQNEKYAENERKIEELVRRRDYWKTISMTRLATQKEAETGGEKEVKPEG